MPREAEPVWLRGAKGSSEPFIPAIVTNVQQGGARLTVKQADGSEQAYDTRNADLFASNPTGATASDHCALIHLNEPCVLSNSRVRFEANEIYTYTGKILVALNPFSSLPIYSYEALHLPTL